MKHKIIKTENYLLVVDDTDIKENDWVYYPEVDEIWCKKLVVGFNKGHIEIKIIAHLPLNNSPILIGVDFLPPLEDEIEELAKKYAKIETNAFYVEEVNKNSHKRSLEQGFISGYNKAKEKYKYTEDDLRKAWNAAYVDALAIDEETYKPLFFEDFIQSFQQPKMPIEFECDMIRGLPIHNSNNVNVKTFIPFKRNTTTNSQGHTEWVGKYIY